jgi:hypothetical protein
MNECELYDPSDDSFTACASQGSAHYSQTATLLQNGTVLLAGGFVLETGSNPIIYSFQPTTAGEIFDPANGFSTVGILNVPRVFHSATLLNNGTVLIAGGEYPETDIAGTAEIYDPAAKRFTFTGSLNAPRATHTATLLSDGKVLITGGWSPLNPDSPDTIPIASAELYNPETSAFTFTGDLKSARQQHTATRLNDGMVLIVGGLDSSYNILKSAELYDPATQTFSFTGSLSTARYVHTATLLRNGMVLIADGRDSNSNALSSAELYNPLTRQFTNITIGLGAARYFHTATLLGNGNVLLAGGYGNPPAPLPLSSAELYWPMR